MLKLYNTLSRKKEGFKPLKKGCAGMYVCGPTIYNFVHIGNLRAYVFADILRRALELNNLKVKEVMNLTDVEDKTIRGSQKAKKCLKDFTKVYEKSFLENLKEMNIEKSEVMPRATEHIKEMVALVKNLLKKKIAYKTDDGIYFSIKKFKNYGNLSGVKKTELKAGASERVRNDEYEKEDAKDFVLWKFYDSEDGDVFWETEIGKGRPGWHIECSAMSMKYLGESFDIHVGGTDLIFPHHENEIAQAEASTGKKFVNYWLHNEWILVDGKKMSKSLGNFYTLEDIKNNGYSATDLRYFYLSGHYRKPLNFTWTNLDSAKNSLKRLKNIISGLEKKGHRFPRDDLPKREASVSPKALNAGRKVNNKNMGLAYKQFIEIIDDDLNSPKALSYMWDILREERLNDTEKYKLVLEFDKFFGLGLGEEEKVKIPTTIKKMVEEREKARKKKDFVTADKIREKINKEGYTIDDTEEGVKVKKG